MGISAMIPVEHVEAANAELDELGFGPNSFSVAMRANNATGAATHVGFHSWDNPAFLAAVQALTYPGLVVKYDEGEEVNFPAMVEERTMDWIEPDRWFENPVMKEDVRTKGGKTWTSLIDNNVWEPPVGWREVVAEGYPAWVQPTGAHDAYPMGGKVSFKGQNYESVIAANVWSPSAYPAGWKAL